MFENSNWQKKKPFSPGSRARIESHSQDLHDNIPREFCPAEEPYEQPWRATRHGCVGEHRVLLSDRNSLWSLTRICCQPGSQGHLARDDHRCGDSVFGPWYHNLEDKLGGVGGEGCRVPEQMVLEEARRRRRT